MTPKICPNLEIDQQSYVKLLQNIAKVPSVKRVFVQSGVRFDAALKDAGFMKELIRNHVSGQLKLPRTRLQQVLRQMNKPAHPVYQEFCRKYSQISSILAKNLRHSLSDLIPSRKHAERRHRTCTVYQKTGPVLRTGPRFYPSSPHCVRDHVYTGENPFTGEKYTFRMKRRRRCRSSSTVSGSPKLAASSESSQESQKRGPYRNWENCLVPGETKSSAKNANAGNKRDFSKYTVILKTRGMKHEKALCYSTRNISSCFRG